MKKLGLSLIAIVLICVGSGSAQTDPDSRALHHFYELKGSNYHYYTADAVEAEKLKKFTTVYKYVGITGYVLGKKRADNKVLIRLKKKQFGGMNHFYTTSVPEAEQAALNGGWTYDGNAGYVPIVETGGLTALYRLYLPCTGAVVSEDLSSSTPCTGGEVHYFTASESEKKAAMKSGYKSYGVTAFIWPGPVPKISSDYFISAADAQKAADRKKMIYQNYKLVFGREPPAGDFSYWDVKATAESTTGTQHFEALRDWLNGPGQGPNDELAAVIQRAFAAVGKTGPTRPQRTFWMNESRTKQYYFSKLKVEINKVPAENQPGGFPESQTQVNERKAMIYKGYAVAFGREPTADDFKYWDAKAKAEGTTYDQHFNALREWLTGGGTNADLELRVTVKRAFAANGKPEPTWAQNLMWVGESKKKKHWYEMLVLEIKQKLN